MKVLQANSTPRATGSPWKSRPERSFRKITVWKSPTRAVTAHAPVKDNAIYHWRPLSCVISAYEFPAQFIDGNRAYFAGMAKIWPAKGDTETPMP